VNEPSGRSATRLVFAVGAVALLVAVLTKRLAVRELTGREPVEVIGDFLQLRLVLNPGAAFGAGGASVTPVISVVAIIATVMVIYFAFRVRHRGWAVALGLLLAGVGGNLIDRMIRDPGPFRGHVVDFFALPHWPVFNVADICIDVAAVMFAVLLVRGDRMDGTRHAHDPRADEE
jgi:signal peptidase II